jgi:hypothetical protein
MARTGPAIEADEAATPPRFHPGFVLALAILGVLFAWVPGLGLILSLAGLGLGVWGLRHRVHPRAAAWAVALAVLGVILGGVFTGLYLTLTPEAPSDAERRTWEQFDRLFDPPAPVDPERVEPPGDPEQPAPPAPPQGPPGADPG